MFKKINPSTEDFSCTCCNFTMPDFVLQDLADHGNKPIPAKPTNLGTTNHQSDLLGSNTCYFLAIYSAINFIPYASLFSS